jgi:hypothetical protein
MTVPTDQLLPLLKTSELLNSKRFNIMESFFSVDVVTFLSITSKGTFQEGHQKGKERLARNHSISRRLSEKKHNFNYYTTVFKSWAIGQLMRH